MESPLRSALWRRAPPPVRQRIVAAKSSRGWRAFLNLADCVRVDTRSLAVFRVVVALLILADLLLRSRNFSFYYTDDGVVPQSLAMVHAGENAFSVYYWTSDPTLIAALFVVQALFAIQLLVGYKTRIAMAVSFLLVVSLDHHNPLVLSYADTLFRLLLFWAIFLPLGERWSIDALHRDRAPRWTFVGAASALALAQMVTMYAQNGYHKYNDDSELWQSGGATPKIFGLDEMTFLLGDYFRHIPTMLEYGGLTWYYMLIASPLLILLWGRPRMLLTFMFVGGHASFALTVRIGAFAYVAIAGLILFLQPQFWRDAATLVRAANLQDHVETAGNGVERVGRRIASVLPSVVFDSSRQQLARAIGYKAAIVIVAGSMVLLTLSAGVQFAGVADDSVGPTDEIQEYQDRFGVEQPEWSIFAPTPRTTDRYYVFPARTADGEMYDVFNDRELTYDRPYDELQKQHDAYRERFYMNSIRRAGDDGAAPEYLVEHICETWADERGVELTQVNVYEVIERIDRDSIDDPDERERHYFLRSMHGCDGHEPEDFAPPD